MTVPVEENAGGSSSAASILMETVQWSSLIDVDDLDPVSEADYEVLSEVQEVLRKRGALERFGICLLHRHFDVNEGELAVEYTDVESRVSTVRVESAAEAEGPFLETMWRFADRPTGVTVCVRRCSYSSGHRNVHVKEGR